MFPNMNIALHLRREVLNYKVCIETWTCHPKRWTCWNIDTCKNIKNKAFFMYYSEIWHLAQYAWTETSVRPGRMTDSAPVYKEVEFHIIRSSCHIITRISYLICRYVFFPPFRYFSLQIYTFLSFLSSLSFVHHLAFSSSDSSYYRDRSFPSSCFTCPSSYLFVSPLPPSFLLPE